MGTHLGVPGRTISTCMIAQNFYIVHFDLYFCVLKYIMLSQPT